MEHDAPDCNEAGLPAPKPMSVERVAAIGKALGHPARVRILMMFQLGRCLTATSVAEQCDLAQSTVSEHLRVLREADLLFARRDGTRIWYCLRRSVLHAYASSADLIADTQPAAAHILETV